MAAASIPHFALPFRFTASDTWHAATSEQDSAIEITECVEAIIRYPVGYRPELPDFGVPDPLFAAAIDLPALAAVIERWEPRARVTTEAELDALDALARAVTITVEVAQ